MASPKSAVIPIYIVGGVMLVIACILMANGRNGTAAIIACLSSVVFGTGVTVLASSKKPSDKPSS